MHKQILTPDQPDLKNKTLTEFIQHQLRQDIILGIHKPKVHLTMKSLTKQYRSSSSSPIREALSRLTATNMVVSEGQKGFYTPDVSLQVFNDISTAFQVMRLHTFEYSINRLSLGQITQAESYLKNIETLSTQEHNDPHAWVMQSQKFYRSLTDACSSSYLQSYYLQLSQHIERYQHHILHYNNNPSITIRPIREYQILQHIRDKAFDVALSIINKTQQKWMDSILSQLVRIEQETTNDEAIWTQAGSQSPWQTTVY